MSDETITSALRLIKEALFTFGADGDECIQKLVSVQAHFAASDIFTAFYHGLTGDEAAEPSAAYELGGAAAQLNERRRRESGLNIGPFDTPDMRWQLSRAAQRIGM